DEQRHDHMRENDNVAKRQDGIAVGHAGCGEFTLLAGHLGVLSVTAGRKFRLRSFRSAHAAKVSGPIFGSSLPAPDASASCAARPLLSVGGVGATLTGRWGGASRVSSFL